VEVCLAEIHTGEVRSGEVRLGRFCPGEIRQDKVRPVEISTREVRLQKEVPLTQGVPSYCCDAHGYLDHSFRGMRYEQIRKDSVAVAHLHLVANLELRIQTPERAARPGELLPTQAQSLRGLESGEVVRRRLSMALETASSTTPTGYWSGRENSKGGYPPSTTSSMDTP
jgi:hypothetical protein